MCGKGEINYTQKYLCGCILIMVVIIVILAMVINFGGESGASVEMSGENESAIVEESSGLHLLEKMVQVWGPMVVLGGLGWKFFVLC